MELAQMLPDGAISATWLFGIMTVGLGWLITTKLNRLEKTLEYHGREIQDVKMSQVEVKTNINNIYQRLEKMDEEWEDALRRFRNTKGAAGGN